MAGCLNLQKRSDIDTLKRVRVDKEASSLVLFRSWYASEGDLDRNMEALMYRLTIGKEKDASSNVYCKNCDVI